MNGLRSALGRSVAAVAVTLLFAVIAWGGARPAEAHAVLTSSSPAAGAELSEPPNAIDLWFSEPLEPRFTSFELLDGDGAALPVDGIVVDPTDPYHLSGLPRRLEPGIYTVFYRNVSQSDGHEWSGSFSFTVLNPDGSVPTGQAYQPELGAANSPANIIGRWFTFLGFTLVAGGAVFLWPLRRHAEATRRLAPVHAEATRRIALVGLPLLVAGGALVISAQAQAVPGASALDIAAGTRGGTLWLWRMIAVEAIAVLLALSFLARRWRHRRGEQLTLALLPLAAFGGIATVALLSHAAAAPGFGFHVLTDVLHLWLAAGWVGGLAVLGVMLVAVRRHLPEERAAAMVYLVAPFAVFAAVSVYGLAVSGVVRVLGEIPTLSVLWETEYGRWLLAKLVLVAAMLGVAFLNRRAVQAVHRSSGRTALEAAAGRVRRLLPVELALGIAILFSVGVFGQVPTPRGAAEAPASVADIMQVFNGVQQDGDVNVHLQVTPATVGPNTLRLHLYGEHGRTFEDVQRVRITFARPGALGGEQVDATPAGRGIYTATGSFLSLALTWELTVDVSRAGQDDVRLGFSVPIAPGAAGGERAGAWSSPAPQITTRLLASILALMAGVGLALGWRRHPRWSAATQTAGWVVVLGAIWIGTTGDRTSGFQNPTPGDPAAIERGGTLYAQQCVTCHGVDGRGDGPAAAGLQPPPADLRLHIPLHTDAETFLFITRGVPNTAMPAWEDVLTEAERWDLVNYLLDAYSGDEPLGP